MRPVMGFSRISHFATYLKREGSHFNQIAIQLAQHKYNKMKINSPIIEKREFRFLKQESIIVIFISLI